MKNYELSLYKFLGVPGEFDLESIGPTEDYFEIGVDKYYIYFSPHSGILIKNLQTKITEKFEKNLKITFIRAVEDLSTNQMLVTFMTDNEMIIKKYDTLFEDFKTITKPKDFNKYYLVNFDSKTFIIYLNTSDNKIYCLSSEDDFETSIVLSRRNFEKQEIRSVGFDVVNQLPFVYLEVIDNTLLRGIDKHLNLNNNRFVEIYTHHKLYIKEIVVE